MGLPEVVQVLETYRGREKTLRTLQYGLLFLTTATRHSSRAALEAISSQVGATRVILRLLDDLSMLQYSQEVLRQGKGKDWVVRCLEVVNIMVDQLFFPVEHVAWARDVKLLQGSSSPFWHASLFLWAASMVLTILRSLREISLMQQDATRLTNEEKERRDEKHEAELLTIIMNAADLLNCLNWLPNRPWSKPFPVWQVRSQRTWRPWHLPFPVWQVGVFGLVSSLIGFHKLLTAKR